MTCRQSLFYILKLKQMLLRKLRNGHIEVVHLTLFSRTRVYLHFSNFPKVQSMLHDEPMGRVLNIINNIYFRVFFWNFLVVFHHEIVIFMTYALNTVYFS